MTESELLEDFPTLELDDLRAALEFAALRERRLNDRVKLETLSTSRLSS